MSLVAYIETNASRQRHLQEQIELADNDLDVAIINDHAMKQISIIANANDVLIGIVDDLDTLSRIVTNITLSPFIEDDGIDGYDELITTVKGLPNYVEKHDFILDDWEAPANNKET